MVQPISPDYGQQFLLPPALEEWVPKDHPARYLREFVDQLNLAQLGFAMPSGADGRPPYAPSLLLKIWLYGYFHRIRSTRKLEVACREHMSLLWLTGLIQPDHNSLWRFWNTNKKALREVFKQTVRSALETGAVGLALQALDGTKIQAACSGPKGWRKEYMEKMLAQLDAATQEIENTVAQENPALDPAPGYRLPETLQERQALREQIKTALAQIKEEGRKHYHPAEPEARRMKTGDVNRYGYNAQAVADAKEGIIVACQAGREENDVGQLAPMIEQARQNTSSSQPATQPAMQPTTVADTGYGSGADLHAAQEIKADVLAPPKSNDEENPYSAPHFVYDAKDNTVTCPQGRQLDREAAVPA
jgi:transposase